MLDLLFGTVKENAQRELLDYDPATGTRKKDLGDHIGDFFTGRGSAIDKAVKDLYLQQLDEEFGTPISRLKRTLGATDLTPEQLDSLKLTENTNARKLRGIIQDLQIDAGRRTDLLGQANQLGYGAEAALLPTDQITGMLRTKAEEKVDEEDAKEERIRLENKLERQQRYRDDLDLQRQTLLMNQQLRQDENAFRMEQLLQQNNRFDRQDARDARRDQQAFVALLLQGLNNLQF